MAGKRFLGKPFPDDSTDTLGVKSFVKIALSCTVSEISVFLCFTKKFKMAAKNSRKMIFGKSRNRTLRIPFGSNFFSQIALSHTISEINAFWCFAQKFKLAAKNSRKMIFGKSRQLTLWIPCESKISPKSLYLTLFPR